MDMVMVYIQTHKQYDWIRLEGENNDTKTLGVKKGSSIVIAVMVFVHQWWSNNLKIFILHDCFD